MSKDKKLLQEAAETEQSEKERALVESRARKATQSARELRSMNRVLLDTVALLEEDLDLVAAIRESNLSPGKITAPKKKSKKHRAIPVAVASDWHIEEKVDPKTVSGRNEHNLKVSKQRSDRFFMEVAKLYESTSHVYEVDTLVLALLGDFMSGHIHPDLIEVTELTPTECIVELMSILEGGIDYLLENTDAKHLVIPTAYGNHGRDTNKPRISTGGSHSYEQVLYKQLARLYEKNKRVRFIISTGYHNMVDFDGYLVRFHHGDSVRYAGGVGGLTIPLAKRVAAWNRGMKERVDLDVLGHWHQFLDLQYAIVNGSMIGYSPYAINIGAPWEPPQQAFFVIDTDIRRKVSVSSVVLDDKSD